ncbi:MAG: hypothetical protein JNM18_04695 [Planctomycetaceae bacterium]|nr:hypothetical protein [Planctomycetaceae bacterium]
MDPFRTCLALGPLAVYALLLAVMHLSRRAWVVNGNRDLITLGVAVSGMVLIGPIELLMPAEHWVAQRGYAWLVVMVIYVVVLSLVALLGRPRITVYNITPAILRPILARIAAALDPQARWAGNSLVLPQLEMELHVEAMSPMQTVSIVATHEEQELVGWKRLEVELIDALRGVERTRNPWGYLFVSVALLFGALVALQLIVYPDAVAQGFSEMMRLD